MVRDTVILAGGFGLPYRTASAVRALGLASLIQRLGYKVVVLGKFDPVPGIDGADYEQVIDGIPCRDIRHPIPGCRFASYVSSAGPVMATVDEAGASRVKAVLAYNYPARGALALILGCRSRGIAPVLDCTEWYGWEGPKVVRNLWRLAGVEVRMRILTRLAGNVICVSSWLQGKLPNQNTLLLPPVLDVDDSKWERGKATPGTIDQVVNFVYSGSPGTSLYKDRLPLMIEAFESLVHERNNFGCTIAGVTEAQYLTDVPTHNKVLREIGDRVRFLGRITHSKSLELLRGADFSVFFRKPNRVSNAGFPTKFVEAATLGVPVISNATSDIPRYLRDGHNGILAKGISNKEIYDALSRALAMSASERAAMRAACHAENPFAMEEWADDLAHFLDNLRVVHD